MCELCLDDDSALGHPNYSRPAFSPQPKATPRIVEKVDKRRKAATMDAKEKEAVRARDKEACRVCLRHSREVHERLFKSLGGVASLANSMTVCHICHLYLQGHAIQVFGPSCNAPLTFEMGPEVAKHVFRGRSTPNWVTVKP